MKKYRITFKKMPHSEFIPTDDPLTNGHLREVAIECLRNHLHYLADLPEKEFSKLTTEYEYDDGL